MSQANQNIIVMNSAKRKVFSYPGISSSNYKVWLFTQLQCSKECYWLIAKHSVVWIHQLL